ncbi:hypothetical protein [Streptomyces sp. CB02009]|uniref:hypothetical protein n=1 Tax=Streptomyces sp. CB02009 TaxID=1703938 RepID=UPI0009A10562|nr:hypothetical protein [Streptomyces sp. CB02009]
MSENPATGSDGIGQVTEGADSADSADSADTDGVDSADRGSGADDGRAQGAVGCLLAVGGIAAAGVFALPRAAYSIDGGFEAHARDWSVILVELPLILLAGLLVPPVAWAAATRWLRPWAAFLVCAAVVALGLWGVSVVWHPRQGPDPGYGPGI